MISSLFIWSRVPFATGSLEPRSAFWGGPTSLFLMWRAGKKIGSNLLITLKHNNRRINRSFLGFQCCDDSGSDHDLFLDHDNAFF